MSDYNQGNSFYDSDSFESDTEYHKKNVPRKTATSQSLSNRKEQLYKDYKVSNAAKNRQRNNNKKLIQHKRLNISELEAAAQRILSARKHKISDQSNIIQELQKQIEILQLENKTLKSQSFRQEKELSKFDSKHSDLPRIFEQHQSEISTLKDQLRRTKELLNVEIKQKKDYDNEILKLRAALTKANQILSDKNLGERSNLQTQLLDAQEKLETTEKLLEATNKHVENLEKSHKREIYNLKKHIRLYENQCHNLEKELEQVKTNLKEKSKLLEIQNIYSHRFKIPHRLPGSSSDHQINESGQQSDLNFRNSNRRESFSNKPSPQPNHKDDSLNLKYLDPEKIKDDIRKILEEEIFSGRIKPIEYHQHDIHPSVNLNNNLSEDCAADRMTPLQDSYNTGRTISSEILDKEPQTEVGSEAIDIPKIDPEQMEREMRQKQILLEKLNSVSEKNNQFGSNERLTSLETYETTDLKFSYPKDDDFVAHDSSISDIETISAVIVKKPVKSYKFSETIENLHQGIPNHANNFNQNSKRHTSDLKKCVVLSRNELNDIQIDSVLEQKNNSNIDQSCNEPLPRLTEVHRRNKERELMSELFGLTQSNGTLKNCTTTLPWDNKELAKRNSNINSSNTQLNELGESEELEEIML